MPNDVTVEAATVASVVGEVIVAYTELRTVVAGAITN